MKYVEIIIESFATYFYLILLLRILGKKEMSKLSISDLIVFLIISELMTLSIGNDDVTFFQASLASLVVVLSDKACSYLSMKSKRVKKILEGNATYIVYQGKLAQEKMTALNYSVDDLCHHLRQEGIGSLSEVEFAVLETDGNLSVITKEDNNVLIPDVLISDEEINYDVLKILNKNESWLMKQLKKENIEDYHHIFYCIMENDGLFYIKK